MATRYLKHETKITWGPNSDYSDPSRIYEPESPSVLTPEAVECIDNLEIGTGAETLMRTDRYTTMTKFYVKNKDASNYVTVTYKEASLAGTITLRVLAGQELLLSNVDPAQSPTLQANGAAVPVDIVMCGES